MNLILGICVGAAVGWMAFKALKATNEQGLRTALLIGLLGGGIGAQLAEMFGATVSTDGHFNLISLFVSAVAAVAFLLASRMITNRGNA